MADIQRTVGVKLVTETEGDAAAFQETAEQVGTLGDAVSETADVLPDISDGLRDATNEVNSFGDAVGHTGDVLPDINDSLREFKGTVEESGEATDRKVKRVNELSDILELAGGKTAAMTTKVLALVGALKAGYEAGQLLREGLNWATDGEFDEGVQSFLSSVLLLDDGMNTAAQAAENYRNNLNILRDNGIDPTKMSAAEAAEAVENLGKSMQAASIAASNAAGGFSKFGAEANEAGAKAEEAAAKIEKTAAGLSKASEGLAGAFANADLSSLDEMLAKMRELQGAAMAAAAAVAKVWDPLGTGGPQLDIAQGIMDANAAASGRGTGSVI